MKLQIPDCFMKSHAKRLRLLPIELQYKRTTFPSCKSLIETFTYCCSPSLNFYAQIKDDIQW